jgi:hypothetical protein
MPNILERNAPCPCGSGKKYKKCCGALATRGAPDITTINQLIAYRGVVGRRRESWCAGYLQFKRDNIAEVERMLREDVAAASRAITCHKGCATCCSAYVTASLQECEGIVYWLYQHPDVMRSFLTAFQVWRQKIIGIQELFNRVYALQDRAVSRPTTEEERTELLIALSDFMKCGVLCPFLKDGACSIYQVRPFVCAGVVSTTPSEWCLASHPRHAEVVLHKADAYFENDMPYFLKLDRVSYGCVPVMVYTLLRGGYATLSTVPGLEGLQEEVYRDPEVRAKLLGAGYLPAETELPSR